jgi:hypothetical protein
MNTTTNDRPVAKKRLRWLRLLLWGFAGLVLLGIAGYFTVTSSAFIKGVVLPKAGKAMHADITASDASVSLFSQVVLRDLSVRTTGSAPLFSAPEIRLRYSLMDILRGNLLVDEVAVVSPVVNVEFNADGTSNLDPLTQSPQSGATPPAPATTGAAKPLQLALKQLLLTNATFHYTSVLTNGAKDTITISNFTLSVNDVRNGATGRLGISADIFVNKLLPAPGGPSSLEARIRGGFDFTLTSDLKPASLKGGIQMEVPRAAGALAQASGFVAILESDLSPTEIKQLGFQFKQGATPLGRLMLSGPFDASTQEGRLNLVLAGIDKRLLNLAVAGSGLDFGSTTLHSTNEITLAKSAGRITVAGAIDIGELQINRPGQPLPAIGLKTGYALTFDRASNRLDIASFTMQGEQKGRTLLRAGLASPMTVALGAAGAEGIGDSKFTLSLDRLNLADWKSVMKDDTLTGNVSVSLDVASKKAGRQNAIQVAVEVQNLSANTGAVQVSSFSLKSDLNHSTTNFSQNSVKGSVKIPAFNAIAAGNTISSAGANITLDVTHGPASVAVAGQLEMLDVQAASAGLALPPVSLESGFSLVQDMTTNRMEVKSLTLKARQAGRTILNGTLAIPLMLAFNNKIPIASDTRFTLSLDRLDLSQWKAVAGDASLGGEASLKLDLVASKAGADNTLDLSGQIQNLSANTGAVQVSSLSLHSLVHHTTPDFKQNNIQGSLTLSNLNAKISGDSFNNLGAGLTMDVVQSPVRIDLKTMRLALTPTPRAGNVLQLSGVVDLSNTNFVQGNLKLASESLDFTRYYDLVSPTNAVKSPAAKTVSEAPRKTAGSSGFELPVVHLPVRDFTFDIDIGRLYLREVDIAGFQATTRLDDGHVVLKPCKLTLNNAPISAGVDVDMGVPGWKYDVSFSADSVPLPPLVGTFVPDKKGIVKGTFTARSQIAGAGTTGASLQQNLSGQFDFTSTNLNLSATNMPTKVLKLLVATVAEVPKLVKNAGGIGGDLLKTTLGSGSSTNVDLSKSAIDSIAAKGRMGSGKITVQQAMIQSPGFQILAPATVTLAPELTNSTFELPATVSLARSVAVQCHLAAGVATNVPYVELPAFLTLHGTVDNPQKRLETAALLKYAVQQMAAQGVGGKGTGGQLLQGLGSLLGGRPSTNAPATGTNAAATPQNQKQAQTPTNNVNTLLRGLFK